jgi:hypothetical protein
LSVLVSYPMVASEKNKMSILCMRQSYSEPTQRHGVLSTQQVGTSHDS